MKPFQSDRFSCSISAHAEVGPCLEYATFSIRRFNIIVICPRCLIQSYSSLGVAAPKHFRAWKATANRTDFAAQSVRLISVTHLLMMMMFITISARDLLASFARFAQKLGQMQDKVCHANQHAPGSRPQQLQLLASLQSSRTSDAWQSSVNPTQSSACMQCAVASTEQVLVQSHPRSRCVSRRIHGAGA